MLKEPIQKYSNIWRNAKGKKAVVINQCLNQLLHQSNNRYQLHKLLAILTLTYM
jgi:DNA polymerase III delta prime subunit